MDQNKKKPSETNKSIFYGILGLLFIFVVWAIFALIKVKQGYNENLFPGPVIVIKRMIDDLSDNSVWNAIGWTFLRLLIGFGISFILAAIIGSIAGFHERFRYFISPIIFSMKSVPTAAITFVILSIIGGNWTPCALVFLVCFPIIYESFVKGIMNLDQNILKAVSMDSSIHNLNVYNKIVFPSIFPYVSLSILTSLGLAMKVSVMSEIVAGGSSTTGIGRLIYIANQIEVDIPNVYALSLITILIICIFNLVLKFAKQQLNKKISTN